MGSVITGSPSVASEVRDAIFKELYRHVSNIDGNDRHEKTSGLEKKWLVGIYRDRDFEPIWLDDGKLNSEGLIAVTALLNADLDGLNPENYHTRELASYQRSDDQRQLALLDLTITNGFLRYSSDIGTGRSSARLAFPELFPEAGSAMFEPADALARAKASDGLDAYFKALQPQHRYYQQLKDELAEYRKIERLGGYPQIGAGETLHPGENDARVPLFRQLLTIVGDLDQNTETGNHYDRHTVEAVKRFQRRHDLDPDGIVGRRTVAEMNVPVSVRIEQIILNLERWRWHDHKLGDTYVLVNIAGFDLKAVKMGRLELEMPVIVGQQRHESPVFSDRIRYVEFNPFWTLTPHIARTETLIHLRQDPEYLEKKHIRLFSNWGHEAVELDPASIDWNSVSPRGMNSYKLRQDPGEWNALGTMKFIFPNKYSVYLHDTPNHDLFGASSRAFSHGCIRLSDPAALAIFLLDGQRGEWDRERVGGIVQSEERTIVTLVDRIPVHLTYLTAWHDEDGLLRFSEDIYNRDARLQKALSGKQW